MPDRREFNLVLHSALREKDKNQYSTTAHVSPTNSINLVYQTYSLVGVQNCNFFFVKGRERSPRESEFTLFMKILKREHK